jgi:agmatine/peptidylarginine deiminase
MKKLILLLAIFTAFSSYAQIKADEELIRRTEEWFKSNPNSQPHWLTPDELLRINEIGKGFIETQPPVGPVRQTAEFERMQSVLIRSPFGIPTAFIKQLSEVTDVLTLVANTTERTTVISNYLSAGIDTSKCDFLITPSDSYWTRDYGPWYVVNESNEVGVCDFVYNRPRPNDDAIPSAVSTYLAEPYYGMRVSHTGGNYMTDGMGVGASTMIVYEESLSQLGITAKEVDQKMNDYLGIHTYHVVEDPNDTYIDHIDCWGKFLDVDKILIRQVPSSHPQYDEIEATAAYFASQKSSYGNNYQLFRVNTPNNEPYSNSLILNDHVFVPIMGTSNDAPALSVYQTAMPGYTITGVLNGTSTPWESTDALHCRTRGVIDKEMLHIYHVAKVFDQSPNKNIEISARIVSYGGHTINDARLYYRTNTGAWNNIAMNYSNGYYKASISPQSPGDQVSYYIRSQDSSGRIETHPFIGSADPHSFGIDYIPEIYVTASDTIRVSLPLNSSAINNFLIENTGGMDLSYSADRIYRGFANEFLQVNELHENDFTLFPGAGYTNSNWTSYSGGAQVTGSSVTGVLTSPQFQTDGYDELYLDLDQNFIFTSGSYSKIEYDNGSGWVQVYYQASQSSSQHLKISLPVGDTGRLRFTGLTKRVSSTSASWFIDNITVNGLNAYYTPYEWLNLEPPVSGTLSPSSGSALNYSCISNGLPAGKYYADIVISSNDQNNPQVKVPVKLTVSDMLSAPLNLRLTGFSTSQAVLQWDEVSGVSVYNVYRSADPYSGFLKIGSSGTTAFTDNDANGNKYFYYVTSGE